MDKTLEARLLSRGSVVSDVWYYCCAYVVHVVHVAIVMPVHMQYCTYVVCAHVVYAILCTSVSTDNVVQMLHIQCWV